MHVQSVSGSGIICLRPERTERFQIAPFFLQVLLFFLQLEFFPFPGFLKPAGLNELNDLPEFIAVEPCSVRFAPIHYDAGAVGKLPTVHKLFALGTGNIGPPGRGSAGACCRHRSGIESHDGLLLFLISANFLKRIIIHPQPPAGRALIEYFFADFDEQK